MKLDFFETQNLNITQTSSFESPLGGIPCMENRVKMYVWFFFFFGVWREVGVVRNLCDLCVRERIHVINLILDPLFFMG